MKSRFIIGIIAITGGIAAGCATTPQVTPQLNEAQNAYSQASNDPMIARYAPVPLHEAAQALNMAENAESEAARKHYAYLAEKKIEMAQFLAAEKAAEDEVDKLRARKDDILLQIRSGEAEQARIEALEAERQLRAYRNEQRQRELTQAQRDAEMARQDALEAQKQLHLHRSEQQQQELMEAQREAELARAEVQDLKKEIEELEARQTERGILLTFGNVLFETDAAGLKPGAELALGKLADFLKKLPDRQVLIEGHTDNTGTEEYNQQLSQERAQAVADGLQIRGISANRITARGLGENYPIAPNTTSEGRQQNRRVEIIIQNQGQSSRPSG